MPAIMAMQYKDQEIKVKNDRLRSYNKTPTSNLSRSIDIDNEKNDNKIRIRNSNYKAGNRNKFVNRS